MSILRGREYFTASEEETIALGRELARQMAPPLLALLIGNLGAGKTALAKGIAAGLGAAAEDEVTSPSFTLVHEYGKGPVKVFHADLYRLEGERQIRSIGFEDLLDQNQAVILVEWGEKMGGLFTGPRWEIHLEDLGGERRRILLEEWDG